MAAFFASLVRFLCRIMPGLPPKLYFLNSLPENAALLDMGCGNGSKFNQYLRIRNDFRLYGCDIVDYSGSALRGVNFRIVNIQNEPLPWPDCTFDGIILNHVVEHLIRTEYAIRETYRVLKKNGRIYIATPSKKSTCYPSFKGWLGPKGGPINFFDDSSHIQAYSRHDLVMLLKTVGFSHIKTGPVRNILIVVIAPLLIIIGFLIRKRDLAIVGIHQLAAWSIYATAEKI